MIRSLMLKIRTKMNGVSQIIIYIVDQGIVLLGIAYRFPRN